MKPKCGLLQQDRFPVTYSKSRIFGLILCFPLGFSKSLDRAVILARIVPCVRDLSHDTSQHVRAALANQISGLAPLLGREATIEHLLPLFLHLLKDEFSEVRLNIISKLQTVNGGMVRCSLMVFFLTSLECLVIDIELLSDSLLPAILELAEDKSWRVRQAIIEYIPLLATQLGKPFFDEQLGNLCMSWLGDTVFSIREAATINLKKLTEVFGVDWAKVAIVPKVMGMGQHPNYLYRMTTVQAIAVCPYFRSADSAANERGQTISPSLTLSIIQSEIIVPLLQLAVDSIPNIRFNVSKALEVLVVAFGSSAEGREFVKQKIVPVLEQQKNDGDADVRFFALQALQKALSILSTSGMYPTY